MNDYALTAKDRWNAFLANPGSRAAEYWANSIAVVDLNTGHTVGATPHERVRVYLPATGRFGLPTIR